ncbi:MFS transporter [Wansuia hejianensis]|jgi:cyanate permease|uniref:MFS transporter n=1 Tax=Wansuia hejianensis TaxID=2763667 RepID=A0A926EY69_9FIRM|nr:MFS transporter [Wansuia hejianensis]MBC8591146.1 MFS transporter [Wansuia hejianensis]
MKQEKAIDSQRWKVLIIIWLALFSGAYAQYQVPPLVNEIIHSLNLTNVQFSSIVTAPMIPAVLFSIIAGTISDRIGVKPIITIGLIIGSIGTTLRFLAIRYWQVFVLMVLSGFGVAFINANISKILGDWFPAEKISKTMGICLTASTLGMTLGMGTTALFPTINSAYVVSSTLSIVSTFLWMILMKSRPKNTLVKESRSVLDNIRILTKSRSLWIGGFGLMLVMGCTMAITGFLPRALSEIRGIDPVTAGLLSSMVMLGTLFSSILSPIISQRIGSFRLYLIVVGVLSSFGVYYAWQTDVTVIWMTMILMGFFLGSSIPIFMSFPMLLKEIGIGLAGSAGGLLATMQLLGAIIIPTYIITPLAGENYNRIFGLASFCMIMMSFLMFFLPELRKKSIISKEK